MGGYCCVLGVDNGFLDMMSKTWAKKKKEGKSDFTKTCFVYQMTSSRE
jgi:hypothetical protein